MPTVPFTDLTAGARAGGAIAFPTDTVPALAVRPDRAAVIFEVKQRSHDKPLILMGASAADLWPYVRGSAAELAQWQALADRHWPGALTLVLPSSDRVPAAINPLESGSVGIRVPKSAIARRILQDTGVLATTSANRSGEPPLRSMAAIAAAFPTVLIPTEEWITATLAAGEAIEGSGQPSTVVRWIGQGWEVLRQGAIAVG
jgi:L-threonylcarbamoyladenylate synthase